MGVQEGIRSRFGIRGMPRFKSSRLIFDGHSVEYRSSFEQGIHPRAVSRGLSFEAAENFRTGRARFWALDLGSALWTAGCKVIASACRRYTCTLLVHGL